MKKEQYHKAIAMRKEGKTYSEILEVVPVAKSTLSLWLRSVGLASIQKQRITRKRKAAQRRGAQSRRTARVQQIESLLHEGREEVGVITERELWLIGAALYWAEGSKQNATSISAGIQFGNSDVRMIRVFLRWLASRKIPESDIGFELYVHDNRKSEAQEFCRWWARNIGVPQDKITRVYFKRDKPATKRTNVGDLYHGLLRIKVRASTTLNRKINGWIEGIVAFCRIV